MSNIQNTSAGPAEKKDSFSSIFGFLMTVIGFAVGVGSMWRFPYVCGSNGGALFVITYIVVILVICIPLLTAEISVGFFTQKTAIPAYKTLKPDSKWYMAGYLHIIVALAVFCYTVPIYAWILSYIWRTATGFFKNMSPDDIANSFTALTGDYKTMFIFAILNWAIIAAIIMGRNVVEKANKFLIPALGVIMVVCIVIGLRVEGSIEGVKYLFKPDTSNFNLLDAVTAAVGQAFFACGVGMLASMVFGSYLENKKENILKQSSIICGSIIFAGIASGMMIFPMVFAFGLEPSAGVGLTMITLPNVFNYIAGGKFIGTLFYIGFYFAALSSAIGLGEATVAVVKDGFHISRKKAAAIVMTLSVVIGTCSIVIPGFLDTVDVFTNNYLLVISGFLISIFVGWIWGMENCLNAINLHNETLRMFITISVKYICPVAVAFVFISNFL